MTRTTRSWYDFVGMKFVDAVNPTDDELHLWAADPNAMYPHEMPQDWDLVIADWDREALIVALASDDRCPQQEFFLRLLYMLAGECFRTLGGRANIPRLQMLLERLASSNSPAMRTFRARAMQLLKDPSSFDRDYWCGGLFRNDDSGNS